MSYIDVDTLRRYIGTDATSDDDELEAAIADAQRVIETITHREFECEADTTRYFDYDNCVDGNELTFDYDICQITTVVNGDGATVSASDYVTNPRNTAPYFQIKLKLGSNIAWTYDDTPEDAIAVTGRWAFSITPPDDIVWATKALAKWFYKQRDTVNTGAGEPLMSASGVIVMPSTLPKNVADILKLYERFRP
ncbi:MAG: hypothetical protein LCI00_16840 [Chloroflexi bacterium]|nr:hypothetical protein [Chloroflexota bacterium]